jgi:hypothetical protein
MARGGGGSRGRHGRRRRMRRKEGWIIIKWTPAHMSQSSSSSSPHLYFPRRGCRAFSISQRRLLHLPSPPPAAPPTPSRGTGWPVVHLPATHASAAGACSAWARAANGEVASSFYRCAPGTGVFLYAITKVACDLCVTKKLVRTCVSST